MYRVHNYVNPWTPYTGPEMSSIQPDDMLGISEIAEMAGVSRQAVHKKYGRS